MQKFSKKYHKINLQQATYKYINPNLVGKTSVTRILNLNSDIFNCLQIIHFETQYANAVILLY